MSVDIAQTASITLITAVPGSGKTLRAVWFMRQAIERGMQVFVCNVNGLKLPEVIDFPDPTKWEGLPAGSLLVIDECQRFFRAERGVPSYIAAMETIRHMGIRLVLLTQHPALIHPNIRALVGYHEHLVRENGKESAIIYSRSRVIDNVRSDKALAVEDHHSWAFPKDCYDLYTSAEVHTVKRTVPHKYKRAALLALIAAVILGGVVLQIRRAVYGDESQPVQAAQNAPSVLAADRAGDKRERIDTAAQYAAQVQPLIADAPFTAPGFVNREFASDPQVFCMASGHQRGKTWITESCTCLTEQGTRYELDLDQCADIARYGGRYNPYKRPLEQQMQGEATEGQVAAQDAQPSPPVPASSFGSVAAYGADGLGAY
ncbi:MAG: zonular occludens toxin domain-containing protein [Thermomonas sp.]|uniref:zonular occludens toxin domain-containing protein n=1 Tax=Thermomonas sp. TaxID=1971895 RepID=UPI0039E71AF3